MKRLLLPLLAVLALCGFRPAPLPPRLDPGPGLPDRAGPRCGHHAAAVPRRQPALDRGEKGHRYSVRLRNHSAERVLVVVSVDGLNAISGEVAAPGQTGYVLNPWQTADISGWRKSQDEVAQFVFTSPGKSYAGRTGRPDNIGVIGIAVFREAGAVLTTPALKPVPGRRRLSTQDAGAQAEAMADSARGSAAAAPAPAQRLGTGHGARETSQVRDTIFERATDYPVQQTELRYDSARNLRARGILPVQQPRQDGPRAFPSQYVPDPPGDDGRR
ncbi:hypothetical protein AB8E26_06440 [Stenotrophomonas rhizophila]|uniref:hypothetical protein n=1 Tax=Stenotrophomonas rhizophila TaxID=216778 RepID=UPI003514D94E